MYHRDISAPLQIFRALLLGRTWNAQNRFQDQLAPRPYPKPDLVGGPAHKGFDNYYCVRDARRTVLPDKIIPLKQLSDGKESKQAAQKPPTPGHAYKWD